MNRIKCFLTGHWWTYLAGIGEEGVEIVKLEFCSRCGKVK